MAKLFLNYQPQIGYSINTYRNNGYYCTPAEFLIEIQNGNSCCSDLSEIKQVLDDGQFFSDIGFDDSEILEDIDYVIKSFE